MASRNNGDGLEQSFTAALKAAEQSPGSDDAWDHLEELADELQRPEEVAELYRGVAASSSLTSDVARRVAERAVRFHEEWFGDQPALVDGLLSDIVQRDPTADWAFERLVVRLTSAESWKELLAAYDRVLSTIRDAARKRQILDDAANVARDFALQPDRAADYMKQRLALDPNNAQLLASLERLYERQERWSDLVALHRERIATLSGGDALELHVRVAELCLDKLGDATGALAELRTLLAEAPGQEAGCVILERLLAKEDAPREVRREALSLLRRNYEAAGRPRDVVAALETALSFVDDDERSPLLREIGSRLAILGEDARALERFGVLIERDANDADARKQLRSLANRSGLHRELVAVLHKAAASAESSAKAGLLLEAASLQKDALGDNDGAIASLREVVDDEGADPATARQAAYSLEALLAAAGQSEARLAVLERLAALESAPSVKRSLLGQAARLSAELGDSERAIAAWTARLAEDPKDRDALDALVALHRAGERWDELARALRRREEASDVPGQQRRDAVARAEIEEEHLGDVAAAIETWSSIQARFGDEADVIVALDRLLSRAEDWPRLESTLARVAAGRRAIAGEVLTRLGEVRGGPLAAPRAAADALAQALAVEPANQRARAQMEALLEHAEARPVALPALLDVYRVLDDWEARVRLTALRVEQEPEPRERVRILREAADLRERRGGDLAGAFEAIVQALPFDPLDLGLEAEAVRLAETLGRWAELAEGLALAAAAADAAPVRAAALRVLAGNIHLDRLHDADEATRCFAAALELDSTRLDAREALIVAAATAGAWAEGATGLVALIEARGRVPDTALDRLEQAATEKEAFPNLVAALRDALRDALERLPVTAAKELALRLAQWSATELGDVTGAVAAAKLAVDLDPFDRGALAALAGLQRAEPGAELVTTLVRIADLDGGGMTALIEAARFAEVHAEADVCERLLHRVVETARDALARSAGDPTALDAVVWAADRLVTRCEAAQRFAEGARIAFESSGLVPVSHGGGAPRRELRMRAADLAERAGQHVTLLEIVHALAHDGVEDVELVRRGIRACEAEGLATESLALRQRELELERDPAARIAIRLAIDESLARGERAGGRVESLRQSLAEVPGHRPTLERLIRVLEDRGRDEELLALLTTQGEAVVATDPALAVELWSRAADVAENRLRDAARAVVALEKIVAVEPQHKALDSLARIASAQGQHAVAAGWLEKRIEGASPQERVNLLLKLARAHLDAEQPAKAVVSAEAAFAEAPKNAAARKLVLSLYRQREDWAALARALSIAAEHVTDADKVLAFAREAAELFRERLHEPEKAVPVLEKAVALVPDDRDLRRMLAEGLRVAGRFDESKRLLEELIADFGRRRSPQRAAVHAELARVLRGQGDHAAAIDQLDEATKMDASNVASLRELAEYAREVGQLDRAERAFRTLLVSVRRGPAEVEAAGIGPAGVLLALAGIAASRGDAASAKELTESALESLAQNPAEGDLLVQGLRAGSDAALFERVLRTLLSVADLKPNRRARYQSELARILERDASRLAEALDTWLDAVRSSPGTPEWHDAARGVAIRVGGDAIARYVALVESLLGTAKRDADVHVRVELLLRLAEAREAAGDFDAAERALEDAESTQVRQTDVWRARVRIAGARGDTQRQIELLERLAALGEDAGEDTRVDALYRMAEVRFASEDTVDEALEALERAITEQPRWERAARILAAGIGARGPITRALELYEQVAREAGVKATLLHALELRANDENGTIEHAREAVDLALEAGEEERAEALMLVATRIAEGLIDGGALVDWALLGLAARRLRSGDMAGAVRWLGEATEVAPLDRVLEVAGRFLAANSGEGADLTLSAKVYEGILGRDSTLRDAWQPLASIYRGLGAIDKLERLVEETLDGLGEVDDRNALRVELAGVLAVDDNRVERAIEVLRDAVLEDPRNERASIMLGELFERLGRDEDLWELLRTRMMTAQDTGDGVAIKSAAFELSRRLQGQNPEEAAAVLRSALEAVPGDVELLRALLAVTSRENDAAEWARLTEELLRAEQRREDAGLALELAAVYEGMGDEGASARALELAYTLDPSDATVRERLFAGFKARGDHEGLARALETAAEGATGESKAQLLEQAAVVRRDELLDPGAAAALFVRAADAVAESGSVDVRRELAIVDAYGAAGTPALAVQRIGDALVRLGEASGSADWAALLAARQALRSSMGDLEGALEDAEALFAHDAMSHAPALFAVLTARRERYEGAGDLEGERGCVLRLAEVSLAVGDVDAARAWLESWVERQKKDVDALVRLRQLETESKRWEVVAKISARLVAITKDEEQVDAALRLFDAALHLGNPEEAKAGLEHARRKQPDEPRIREAMRKVYEAMGAEREVAGLLLEDAKVLEGDVRLAVLKRVAEIGLRVGDLDLATPALEELRSVAPNDGHTLALLADAYVAQSRFDDAERLLDGAIEASKGRRTPELAVLLQRKGRVVGGGGDRRQQLDLLQQAHMIDKANTEITVELAELAEALEEWDLAIKTLRVIAMNDAATAAERSDALLRQAKIAYRRDDRQRALLWARRALQDNPANEDAKAFLASIGE